MRRLRLRKFEIQDQMVNHSQKHQEVVKQQIVKQLGSSEKQEFKKNTPAANKNEVLASQEMSNLSQSLMNYEQIWKLNPAAYPDASATRDSIVFLELLGHNFHKAFKVGLTLLHHLRT